MLWADVRDELAYLYPEEGSARRVVEDALLSTRYITFTGAGVDMWDRIMADANRRDKLLDLMQVAEHEYPDRPTLKIARVVLESGGKLREAPRDSYTEIVNVPQQRDVFTDMVLDAIGSVREDLRSLRDEGERRGDKLTQQVSDLRHETRNDLAYIKPLVESHGLQLHAHSEQLKAQSTQLEAQAGVMQAHAKQIKALEERPELHTSKKLVWIAFAVGIAAAFGGELLTTLVNLWLGR